MRRFGPIVLGALLVLLGGAASAQDDRGGVPVPVPRLPLPGATGPGASAAPPAPVPPDTATAPVVLVRPDAPLRALAVVPDSVTFGDVAWLVAEGEGVAPADSVQLPPWLAPAAEAGRPPAAAAPGPGRVVVPVRVYRFDPFRVTADGARSAVVTVRSRGTDGTQTAPVRSPRLRGWRVVVIAALALATALLLLAARWLWLRRRGPRPRPADRPVPTAAWPRTAVALVGLLDALEAGGEPRRFLDDLAALVRAYAADRFGIAGREMTGPEIVAACRRLGHGAEVGRPFARLLVDLDARRYAPVPASPGWCLAQAAALVAAMADVRIQPEATPLPREEIEAGRRAWERLLGDPRLKGGAAA